MDREKNTVNLDKGNNARQRYSVEEYIASKYGADKEPAESRIRKSNEKGKGVNEQI